VININQQQTHKITTMATAGNGYTTGVDRQSGDVRQRGAPEVELNGRTVLPRLDEEDKKKLQVSPT